MTEREDNIQLVFSFPGIYLEDDDRDSGPNYCRAILPGAGTRDEFGRPQVPVLTRLVCIPEEHDYRIETSSHRRTMVESVLLPPSRDASTIVSDTPPSDDELFPAENVEVIGPVRLMGARALVLNVCPVRYNRAKRLLVGYGIIKVDILLTSVP